jgi:ATP synthase protein I
MWYAGPCFSRRPTVHLEGAFGQVLFVMKDETKKLFRDLWYYSSLSFSIALSIVIGLGIGYWLDTRIFHTSPWFTLIFLGLGVIAGFRNIYLAVQKSRKQ